MKQQRRTVREFQVKDEDGCLDHYPATAAGLAEAMAAYNAAVEAFNGEDEDDAPRIELYEQYQYRYGNDEDWEHDDEEFYQIDERMPTKALQRLVDRINK